jgi:N-carbamoylputrescine amidase
VAAVQCPLGDTAAINIERLTGLIGEAAGDGAQVICLPELLEGPYFCQAQQEEEFARAQPVDQHPTVAHMAKLAQQLRVVITVPFFERAGPHYYNSVAVVDANGDILKNCRGTATYRKSHIPQGPGYEEKFYFRPGDTGLTTWRTAYGCLGVGICWDQWFPEAARLMVLRGAQVLLYPTAIGSEPTAPHLDTQPQWRLAMRGHAVCNRIAVVAANRVGTEGSQEFYGSSFIANHCGEVVAELNRHESGVAHASVSLAAMQIDRAVWGFFRDRRPDLYAELLA